MLQPPPHTPQIKHVVESMPLISNQSFPSRALNYPINFYRTPPLTSLQLSVKAGDQHCIRFHYLSINAQTPHRTKQSTQQLRLRLQLRSIDRSKTPPRRVETLHRRGIEATQKQRSKKGEDKRQKRKNARKREKEERKNRRCGYNTMRTTRRQTLIPLSPPELKKSDQRDRAQEVPRTHAKKGEEAQRNG
jgi:hypothetical protein